MDDVLLYNYFGLLFYPYYSHDTHKERPSLQNLFNQNLPTIYFGQILTLFAFQCSIWS